MLLVALLAWAVPVRAAEQPSCQRVVAMAELDSRIDEAFAAWKSMDVEQFITASDTLLAELRCTEAIVTPTLAARVHELEGLRAFGERQAGRASASFAVARALAPDDGFPSDLVPTGHPLAARVEAAGATPLQRLAVEPPVGPYDVVFDGVDGVGRPVGTPTIAQLADPAGRVAETRLLAAEEPVPFIPPYAALAPPPAVGAQRRPLRVALGVTAGAAAIASGALWLRADAAADEYWDLGTSEVELDDLRSRTNGSVLGAAATGGVAVAAGAALLFTVEW